jgi:SagB-type dehydrogenase family enzyme
MKNNFILLKPKLNNNKTLVEALKKRKSIRKFSTKIISNQTLADLLWAACGINRPKLNMRTNPTAKNWQQIEVYVTKKSGLYLYNAFCQKLKQVLPKDIRQYVGKQEFTNIAPISLIFVANYTKMTEDTPFGKDFYAATDTGFISQNVYLYCAAVNLATVVLGRVNKEKLEKVMQLPKNQKVILTQPVGYPKK